MSHLTDRRVDTIFNEISYPVLQPDSNFDFLDSTEFCHQPSQNSRSSIAGRFLCQDGFLFDHPFLSVARREKVTHSIIIKVFKLASVQPLGALSHSAPHARGALFSSRESITKLRLEKSLKA